MNSLKQLPALFGSKSSLALHYVPALYHLSESPEYSAWCEVFLPTAPKILNTKLIAKHYSLDQAESLRLIFALKSYYALLIKLIAAYRLGHPASMEALETGDHFRTFGISNFCEL